MGFLFYLSTIMPYFYFALGQQQSPLVPIDVRLCTGGFESYHNCEKLRRRLVLDDTLNSQFPGTITFSVNIPGAPQARFRASLKCIPANHTLECAELISQNQADIARFNAEELYGLSKTPKYSNLAPLTAGKTLSYCTSPDCHQYAREYSVAIVKKTSGIRRLSDLRDKKACFGEVGSTTGWTIPVSKLEASDPVNPPIITRRLKRQQMWTNVTRYSDQQSNNGPTNGNANCLLDFDIVNNMFPQSCAPGTWATQKSFADKYSQRLCASCYGTNHSCTIARPQNDPLDCLRSGKGEVAFLSSVEADNFFMESTSGSRDYALLCSLGLRETGEHQSCHWGVIPSDTYVGWNGMSASRNRIPSSAYAEYAHQLYSKAKADYYEEKLIMFLSGEGEHVSVVERLDLNQEKNTVPLLTAEEFLKQKGGEEFYTAMESGFPKCTGKDKMRICVKSNMEMEKCHEMIMAWREAGLPDSLECVLGGSEDDCMKKVNVSKADVSMVSAHRADEANHEGKLKPLMRELSGSSMPEYAIALTTDSGRIKMLNDIKPGNFKVCSSGTDSFSGWEAPNRIFKKLGQISKGSCKLTEAWADIFRGGCVPGAPNISVTLGRPSNIPIDHNKAMKLCSNCGSMRGSCRTPSEASGNPSYYDQYYGDIGALRCLVRRKGDIAFLKSSALQTMMTLKEMGDVDFRTLSSKNFHLLCADGKTSKQEFSSANIQLCNIGEVPHQWMVANKNADEEQLLRWQDLWMLGINRGRRSYDWLKTYVKKQEHILDLIFTNNTMSLERFPTREVSDEYFHDVAYKDWISPFDCSGSGTVTAISLFSTLSLIIISRFL